jgi:hypothetical protein
VLYIDTRSRKFFIFLFLREGVARRVPAAFQKAAGVGGLIPGFLAFYVE